jgi:pentatricopeptide repeat protein
MLTTPLIFVNDSFGAGIVAYKTFIFRGLVELALPLYLYLVITDPRLRPRLKQPIALAVLAYLVISLISTLVGINPERSLWGNFERMGGVYSLLHLVLFYFYVLLVAQLEGGWQKRLLQLLVVVPALVVLNSVSGKLGLPTWAPDTPGTSRLSGTLGNPDFFGAYLCIPLFLAIWLARDARERAKKLIYGVIAALCALGIYLSGTRGALLGVLAGGLVGAVIWLALTNKRRIRRYGLSLLGLGAIATGSLFAFAGHLSQNSLLHRLFTLDDSDSRARLLEWGTALKGYPERPFLGVGPENFYYLSDKYYNPASYGFDTSYLDKPHNLWIEMLVTIGPLGLLAYLATLVFAVWAFYRAYKTARLGLCGFALLTAALVAYQVQDLTLFDSVGPSLTFFAVLGLAGYMWQADSARGVAESETSSRPYSARRKVAWWAVVPASAAALMAIYMTNLAPAQVAADLSRGQSLAISDPQDAAGYFDSATTLPYNFDTTETANKYAEFLSYFAQVATGSDRQLLLNDLLNSTAFSTSVAADYPTELTVWQRLAEDYVTYSAVSGGALDPAAEDAARHAVELAPNRLEAPLLLSVILVTDQKLNEARTTLQQLAQTYPKQSGVSYLTAIVLHEQGQTADGVRWFEEALQDGLRVKTFADVKWVGDYYGGLGEYSKQVALFERVLKGDPNDLDLATALVNAYQRNGQHDKALALYNQIIAADPSRASRMPGVG